MALSITTYSKKNMLPHVFPDGVTANVRNTGFFYVFQTGIDLCIPILSKYTMQLFYDVSIVAQNP